MKTSIQITTQYGRQIVPLGPCPFGGVHGLTLLDTTDRLFACCPKCQVELAIVPAASEDA